MWECLLQLLIRCEARCDQVNVKDVEGGRKEHEEETIDGQHERHDREVIQDMIECLIVSWRIQVELVIRLILPYGEYQMPYADSLEEPIQQVEEGEEEEEGTIVALADTRADPGTV